MPKKYDVIDIVTGRVEYRWTVQEILSEINHSHSDEYTPFDESDWKVGWMDWCEGMFLSIPEILPPLPYHNAEGVLIREAGYNSTTSSFADWGEYKC